MVSASLQAAACAAAAPSARPSLAASRVHVRPAKRASLRPVCVQAPLRQVEPSSQGLAKPATKLPELISKETIRSLEAELDNGLSVAALRRFNDNLAALPADTWEARLRPVMEELSFNLESFNPAFTAVMLQVQRTIGVSDYARRDAALKGLIQPLAGEYGMHNNEPQARTHRELFAAWYADLLRAPLPPAGARAPAAEALFAQMMRDITRPNPDAVEQACYALGYNLAIEYLADYEKTWMLDAFRQLDARVLAPAGRPLTEWVFLEVHAEGEAEHAAIGHDAVAAFVPASAAAVLRAAMQDHDRDFSAFYSHLADLLE